MSLFRLRSQMKTVLLTLVLLVAVFIQSFAQYDAEVKKITGYLSPKAKTYGLAKTDVSSLAVTLAYTDETTGVEHIYAIQKINGLDVIGSSYGLHTRGSFSTDANALFALDNFKQSKVSSPSTTSLQAIEAVMTKVNYKVTKAADLKLKQQAEGVSQKTVYSRNEVKMWDIATRLVYFPNKRTKSITLAWEVQMMDAYKKHFWIAFVDAGTNRVMQTNDAIIHCDFGRPGLVTDLPGEQEMLKNIENKASSATPKSLSVMGNTSPLLGPNNRYKVYDMPFESPIDPGATHSLITNTGNVVASVDGWHNIGSPASATPLTKGNNVQSFYDPAPGPLAGVPPQPATMAPATNTTLGVPPATQPYIFDYPVDLTADPSVYRNAAIVNLFYWNNLMHDVFYQFGFTEAAQNFQSSHTFSTGNKGTPDGVNDEIWAQAQDGGGTNNANMLTLADGVNGQMQMYLWVGSTIDQLVGVNTSTAVPPANGDRYGAIQGQFSATTTPVNLFTNPVLNKNFVIVQASDFSTIGESSQGCSTGQQSVAFPPSNTVTDMIVIIDRGNCSFAEKTLGAQLGGAAGVIIVNNVPGAPPLTMGGADAPGNGINIPAVMISYENGLILKNRLNAGGTINGELRATVPPQPKRDGDFDNGVIAHEYGHGISTRIAAGGANPLGQLGGDEQGGEGWSDFFGLYMTLRTNDLEAASAAHPNGALPTRSIGNYVTYQPYNGRGIRNFPYSYDMAINPTTYSYMALPEYGGSPHPVGFLWCTILYDLMQNFIDQYGMGDDPYQAATPVGTNPPAAAKGNNIALRLIMEGLKLQAASPTFVQQRDGILAADQMLYNGQHACLIWRTFARRGVGASANSGSNARGDESQSFDIPLSCDPNQKLITITKSAVSSTIQNANITYTIIVTNKFPTTVTGVQVSDPLPAGVNFISATPTATSSAGNIVKWTVDLGPSEVKVFTITAAVNTPTGSTVSIKDDNETDGSNWTAGGDLPTSQWSRVNNPAQAFGGNFYWYVSDVPEGGTNSTLAFNYNINATASSRLVFTHKYNTEGGYDGGFLESSIDGGITWVFVPSNLFVSNGYTGGLDGSPLGSPTLPMDPTPAFTGASPGYITSVLNLASFAGQAVVLRFRFNCDPLGTTADPGPGGWWIDDLYVLDNLITTGNVATAITTPTDPIIHLFIGANASSVPANTIVIDDGVFSINIGRLQGQITGANAAQLVWNVYDNNVDNKYFIERKLSADNSEFATIGSLNGNQIGVGNKFIFIDNSILSGKKYQYRIRATELSGQATYTNIVILGYGINKSGFSIYPNPANDNVTLNVTNPNKKAVVMTIFGMLGQKITSVSIGDKESLSIPFNVSSLAKGVYWVQVNCGEDESFTQKLIIQ